VVLSATFGFTHGALVLVPVHGWAAVRLGEFATEHAGRIVAVAEELEAAGQYLALPAWWALAAEVHLLAGARDDAAGCLARARDVEARTGERVYAPRLRELEERLSASPNDVQI
jgi:uncharacterized membrane protein